jgi:putative transposase
MKIQQLSSKKSIFNALIAVLAVTLFSGCEDVIQVDVINNSPKIVVDAFVNNQLDTQTIRLTRSIGYFDSTGKEVGIDLGLNHFLTDSNGDKIDNPRFLRKSEKRLKKAQRKLSKKKKGSQKRLKQKSKVARLHLKVSRQRKDFAVKTAKALIQSNDLVVYEDLKVSDMVKNPQLAKSISDASWSMFTDWLDYLGKIHGKFVVAVNPQYTSQECSSCGNIVKKTLSVRTHVCSCGCVLDRDENAAINILARANTVGRTEIQALGQTIHCLLGESLVDKVTG